MKTVEEWLDDLLDIEPVVLFINDNGLNYLYERDELDFVDYKLLDRVVKKHKIEKEKTYTCATLFI